MDYKKCLFYIDNDKIMSYIFNNKNYELLLNKGEDCFIGNINLFWEWWEKSICLSKNTILDFCFISNNKLFSTEITKYNFIEKSTWNYEEITDFIENIKYSKIKISNNNIEKKFMIKANSLADYYDNSNTEIYFDLFTIPQSNVFTEKNPEKNEFVKEKGILSEYYKKKTEELIK